jgi:hypothetical protein
MNRMNKAIIVLAILLNQRPFLICFCIRNNLQL